MSILDTVAFAIGWGALILIALRALLAAVFWGGTLLFSLCAVVIKFVDARNHRAREEEFARKYGRTLRQLRVTYERLEATMRSPLEWPEWIRRADPWTRIQWAKEQRDLLRNIRSRLNWKGEQTDIKQLTFAGGLR